MFCLFSVKEKRGRDSQPPPLPLSHCYRMSFSLSLKEVKPEEGGGFGLTLARFSRKMKSMQDVLWRKGLSSVSTLARDILPNFPRLLVFTI